MQFVMFTKSFSSMPIGEVADLFADMGLEGVDLAVRPNEHVLPENVATDLPRALEIIGERGLAVPMITTAITDAADPHAATIFRTAARCGIKFLKLGYWPYRGFGSIREQIAEVRRKLAGIERLALEHGVTACIHTHSGEYMSALAPIVAWLLDGFDERALGAYVDPGHMTVEGSLGGWRQGLDLLGDRISLVAVKSFAWFREADPATGALRWRPRLVPYAEGSVRWDEVFALLRQIGFDGIVSVDAPYQSEQSWRRLPLPELIEQARADYAFFRRAIGLP